MKSVQVLVTFIALFLTIHATNDGLTGLVSWDPYSLTVNGSRVFIFSGEFHYQRMPVPELWLVCPTHAVYLGAVCELTRIRTYFRSSVPTDSMQSVYTSFGAIIRHLLASTISRLLEMNVQRVLDYAKDAGLYVIARAGPYVNGETNGGGSALWGSDGSFGNHPRTSDETYHQAWLPWVTAIGKVIAANQITEGGPIILHQVENEFQEIVHSPTNTRVLYMEQLESAYIAPGIKVPSTHNELGERSVSWSTDYENVGGAVNVCGLDSYPGGLSCTNINSGFKVVRSYFQWFSNYSYTQPSYLAEFEGGHFMPWGGSFYDDCLAEHDPAFADVFYENNIGQRTTLLSLYMAWGGTNWGHSAAPAVYTSYDYSAPLRETRQIQDKLYQIKLLGLFTRVSKDLLMTSMVGNGTGWSVSSNDIWTWQLTNPDTHAGFYIIQHSNSASMSSDTFTVSLSTSKGSINVPNVNLNGRQSKIIVTDYTFGKHALLYSTAEVLTYGIMDVDVLVLYLQEGQIGQFVLKNAAAGLTYKQYGSFDFTSTTKNGIETYVYTQGNGQTTIKFSDGLLIYLLDLPTAWQFWAPTTISNPDVLPNNQIFVLGPYLVRNASTSNGVVQISGDSNRTSTIEVYTGDSTVQFIEWNGQRMPAMKTPYGSFTAQIPGTESRSVFLPALDTWRSGNSLPETSPSYDDSKWAVCNKTKTLSPVAPSTLPVLFSSDYGFYSGAKIYRGYFNGTSAESVTLTTSGGLAFGFNAWLNNQHIGGSPGNVSHTTVTSTLSFPSGSINPKNNVLTVLVDYHGHDEVNTDHGIANPRGILGASLSMGKFSLWKIQGNAGGAKGNIDPVRGPMNEGGLYGERVGWHLPGFDANANLPSISSPMHGILYAGVQFYVTTFDLDIDADLDAPLGVELSAPEGTVARMMIWVNGYQYGKYIPHIGPQTRFPIPPGVINPSGSNTLALSLWAQTDAGAKLSDVKLVNYGLYQTDFGFGRDWSYLQPQWDKGREAYA